MRVAHFVVPTPGRSGLYETARELVAGLRELGIDARMVDPAPSKNPVGFKQDEDRGVPVSNIEWARQADVIVSHSGLGDFEKDMTQPAIYVAHGRPRYSFLTERNGGVPVVSYMLAKARDTRFKFCVTFWKRNARLLEGIWGREQVTVLTPPVDKTFWHAVGPDYNFSGLIGVRNYVITEPWREDMDPFESVLAFSRHCDKFKDARLHIYGLHNVKGLEPVLSELRHRGALGEVKGWVDAETLRKIYSSEGVNVIVSSDLMTRTYREAVACGAKLVTPATDSFTCRHDFREINTYSQRDYRDTASEFKELLSECVWPSQAAS